MSSALIDQQKRRTSIDRLEVEIGEMEQLEQQLTHYFADGIYARELFLPAGAMLVGKIHRTTHINIISKGKISVATENGSEIIEAPATIVSPPGTKRAGYVIEDTVWTTIHGSHETDLEVLEKELIAPSFEVLGETSKLEDK
tara:strand:- start:8 stop:433 length:426 start_codon:yes stop_codon:yes gene_type:complete